MPNKSATPKVLGALLHPYRKTEDAKPGHAQESFDALLSHLDLEPGQQ